MPAPEQVCQTCGLKPANNHLCQIVDGRQTNLGLCDDCLRSHATGSGFELPSLKNARCFYCGGAVASGSTNQSWEIAVRKERFHYTCTRCRKLQLQFATEAISVIPSGLPPEEQMRRIEKIVGEVDERVREQIRGDTQ